MNERLSWDLHLGKKRENSMPFSDVTTHPLFPTPLIIANFSETVAKPVNAAIAAMVLQKAATEKSPEITNVGGWQSDTRILEWGGKPVKTVVASLRELVDQVALNLHRAAQRTPID